MESVEYIIGSKHNPVIIALKEWNGRRLLDIRKFYRDKKEESNYLPTKKGISLSSMQLQKMVDVLNENSEEISEYFGSSEDDRSEIELKLVSTIGRRFRFDFSNNRTELILDEDLGNKIGNDKIEMVKNLLYIFQEALADVIEEDEDIDLILDTLSHKMVKYKW